MVPRRQPLDPKGMLSHVRSLAAYGAALAVLGVLIAHAAERLATAVSEAARPRPQAAAKVAAHVSQHRVLDSATWVPTYKGPQRKISRRSTGAVKQAPPNGKVSVFGGLFGAPLATASDGAAEQDQNAAMPNQQPVATYRTLCVRLCDGYYFPISYATTPDYFAKDEAKCAASCGGPVKLYVYPNPGGDPGQMEDLSGQPYSELKTAFLYRTDYVASCTCKAPAWEQEAKDRHRVYALEAEKDSLADQVARSKRSARKSKRKGKPPAASTTIDIAAAEASMREMAAEITQLKGEIDVKEAARTDAAIAAVVAKGIDVSRKGRGKAFARRKAPVTPAFEAGDGQGGTLAASTPPPWDAPMALGAGGSKAKPKIWGNGPNAHSAPRGRAAADDVFRANFY